MIHEGTTGVKQRMPIYEFHCKNCGEVFELLCKVGEDESKVICPECGADGVKRVMSRFSAHGVQGGSKSCGPSCSGTCSTCGT